MDITITTTAAQDAILERLRGKLNAERAAQTPPLAPLADLTALVVHVLTNAVLSYRQQQIAEDLAAVGAVFESGTNAQRNAIRAAAGL